MSTVNKGLGILGVIAVVALIAAKPGFIAPTFKGVAQDIKAAKS